MRLKRIQQLRFKYKSIRATRVNKVPSRRLSSRSRIDPVRIGPLSRYNRSPLINISILIALFRATVACLAQFSLTSFEMDRKTRGQWAHTHPIHHRFRSFNRKAILWGPKDSRIGRGLGIKTDGIQTRWIKKGKSYNNLVNLSSPTTVTLKTIRHPTNSRPRSLRIIKISTNLPNKSIKLHHSCLLSAKSWINIKMGAPVRCSNAIRR